MRWQSSSICLVYSRKTSLWNIWITPLLLQNNSGSCAWVSPKSTNKCNLNSCICKYTIFRLSSWSWDDKQLLVCCLSTMAFIADEHKNAFCSKDHREVYMAQHPDLRHNIPIFNITSEQVYSQRLFYVASSKHHMLGLKNFTPPTSSLVFTKKQHWFCID